MRGTSRIAKVAELGLVWSMILAACVAPAARQNQTGEDRSYDQIERARSLMGQAVAEDHSYDQIERARSLMGQAVAEDRSYDQIERARSLMGQAVAEGHSYGLIERKHSAGR